ncbi:LytTR family transcriptional regulator DNA-binding domain-containing protein [Chengkuizengella axinellae]|uniref:LytTR family transcriptional regulator DNA-binding domain-containing protein n=1 Tax=Chengkuizengella axinellae TaxID=3064388 RepID=A0ABT9J1E7_9BACL|nr:LytTR family transcriptional regulator DNA-binding domain-containing protein [Chengkuizengella sp. 2205SS18-9]MDP5275405.1 LytTR family transcriptional regulator DNA-binding domain-containing protein [Chengkuizengella sp. 2205SS18-9]
MNILTIKQLEKNIGNTVLFPVIDLEIQAREIVAIQCNSDVGSKLIQLLIGEMPVSSGEILLFETPLNKNLKNLIQKVGIVFLNDSLYERLTPKQYLQFYKQLFQVETDIDSILEQVGLSNKSKVKISRLTFSEQKRLHLARVLVYEPKLIILEEPDQNIDIESKMIIQKVINDFVANDRAVLITTSYLESAIMMSNRVYHLNDQGLKKVDVLDVEDKDSLKNADKEEKDQLEEQSIDNVSVESNAFKDTISMTEEKTAEKDVIEDESQESEAVLPTKIQVRFEKIPAKVDEKIILFDPTEIDFIESSEGISHLHVKGEVFPCTYTLNDLFDRLQPFGFFRCHRSYIVNLQKVREVITWTRNSYSLILDNSKKSSIPLSKGKLSDLKDIIGF